MEGISQEVYEQVKAQVLSELKEERRERAKAREEEQDAIHRMFEPFRQAYYLRLVQRYEHIRRLHTNLASAEITIEKWFEEIESMALSRIHETRKSAYRNGRAEEVNRIAMEILETILEGK